MQDLTIETNLETAFKAAQRLSQEDQLELAEELEASIAIRKHRFQLSPAQLAELDRAIRDAEHGAFVPQNEMAAFWGKYHAL